MKREILLPIHTYPDGHADSLARHAAAIAQQLNASVHAIVLDADFPVISSGLGGLLIDVPTLVGGAKARCRERGAAFVSVLQTEMRGFDVPLRTSHVECFPGAIGDILSSIARYHDFTLVGIRAGNVTTQATAESVIFGSGRPTLLIPEDRPISKISHVMIGWDGSRVAARAVADARDLLQQAKTVTIASVIDEKALAGEDVGDQLSKYLSQRNISATVGRVQGRGRPVADTLQEYATEIGAGILVMGGFAHSRVRDFVLGGATSGVLKNPRTPVFLSH